MRTDVSELFRVLADPTRRTLFERLARKGELTVSALTAGSGVSQPAVSQHLGALKSAGLVSDRREGRSVYYRADPRGLEPIGSWLESYTTFWVERFKRLEKLLEEVDE